MFERLSPLARKIIAVPALIIPFVLVVSTATDAPPEETPDVIAPVIVDLGAGRKLAESICDTCHGDAAATNMADVPRLNGQHAEYIVSSLTAHHIGDRANDRVGPVAEDLDNNDIRNVATYYASLAPFSNGTRGEPETTSAEVLIDQDPFADIRDLATSCSSCHGEDGNTEIPGMPGIAGQHMPYLIASMKAYKDGSRPGMMQNFIRNLSDSQIEDLGYFFASMTPKRTETPPGGDPFAGVAVARACAGCHGDDGNIDSQDIPRLAGLDAAYLVSAIKGYRSGDRKHSGMKDAVATLREVEIRDVSAYYAGTEPDPNAIRKPLTMVQWAQRCNRCHDADGISSEPSIPILVGQSEEYLINALTDYHLGTHSNSVMYAMTFHLTRSDIEKLAAYYASRTTK